MFCSPGYALENKAHFMWALFLDSFHQLIFYSEAAGGIIGSGFVAHKSLVDKTVWISSLDSGGFYQLVPCLVKCHFDCPYPIAF